MRTITATQAIAGLSGATIGRDQFNLLGYLEVTFRGSSGNAVDHASINGGELELRDAAGNLVALSGTLTRVGLTDTYRYGLAAPLVSGAYSVTFVGGSFSDTAGVVNQAETEIFTLAVATAALADPTHATVIDRGELEGRGWVDVTFGAFGGQDFDPLSITDADAEITLTSPGSTIVVDGRAVNLGNGKFRFFYTGYGRKTRR